MKKKSTKLQLLLTLVCLFAFTALKAQTVAGTTNLYCIGSTVKIAAQHDATAASYIWKRYVGQGTGGTMTTLTTQTTENMTDAPTDPGYYTYVSVAVNSNSCESAPSDPVVIYVLPDVTASIDNSYASNDICATVLPATGTLTAKPGKAQSVAETFANTDYTYQWYKGGTLIPGATNITYTLTAADIAAAAANVAFTVKIKYAAHACNEAESAPVNMNVIALPNKPVISVTP